MEMNVRFEFIWTTPISDAWFWHKPNAHGETNSQSWKKSWHSHLYLIVIKWSIELFVVWIDSGDPKLWGVCACVCGYLNKWIFLKSNDTRTHTPNTHPNEYWLSILIYVFSSPITQTHNKIVNKFIFLKLMAEIFFLLSCLAALNS